MYVLLIVSRYANLQSNHLVNIVYLLIFKVKEEVGNVSILVNNAGVVYTSDLFATQDAQIEKTFEVNVLAHFWVSAISFTKYCLLKTQRLRVHS